MDWDFSSILLGVFVGLAIAYLIANQLGKMLVRRLEAELPQKSESKRIEMKVEKHGDVIYAFRLDTDDFVCQGADLAEIKRNFVARFPGQDGAILEVPDEMLRKQLMEQKKELIN